MREIDRNAAIRWASNYVTTHIPEIGPVSEPSDSFMAPRIVSWSNKEICKSPVLSNSASIISFDSTLSGPAPNHSSMSITASEALGLPSDKFGARFSNVPVVSDERRTPRGGHATLDDSFVRHDAYYFKDGNVTFLVCGSPIFAYSMC